MITKWLLAAILIGCIFTVEATIGENREAIPGWVIIAGSDQFTIYAKNGSFKITNGIMSVDAQQISTAENPKKMNFFCKLTIAESSCESESGTLKIYFPSGEYAGGQDYSKGDDRVASFVSKSLCMLRTNRFFKYDSRGFLTNQ